MAKGPKPMATKAWPSATRTTFSSTRRAGRPGSKRDLENEVSEVVLVTEGGVTMAITMPPGLAVVWLEVVSVQSRGLEGLWAADFGHFAEWDEESVVLDDG